LILSRTKDAFLQASRTASAFSLFSILAFLPSIFARAALNSGGFAARSRAETFQNSSTTKALISFSRSQMSRRATDWTRPALRPRPIFFQRSGLMR
jgi:hypothetical protein